MLQYILLRPIMAATNLRAVIINGQVADDPTSFQIVGNPLDSVVVFVAAGYHTHRLVLAGRLLLLFQIRHAFRLTNNTTHMMGPIATLEPQTKMPFRVARRSISRFCQRLLGRVHLPASFFAGAPGKFRYFSNHFKVCDTLAIIWLGRAPMLCEAPGIRTKAVSILRSFNA